MLIGNIAQQFYNTADSIIVGKYIGDNALAAVGSAGPVLNLLLVFLWELPQGTVSWLHKFLAPRIVRPYRAPLGSL